MKRPWRLEYVRPDRWSVLATYATRERAEAQMVLQLERYPRAKYRVVRRSE